MELYYESLMESILTALLAGAFTFVFSMIILYFTLRRGDKNDK